MLVLTGKENVTRSVTIVTETKESIFTVMRYQSGDLKTYLKAK